MTFQFGKLAAISLVILVYGCSSARSKVNKGSGSAGQTPSGPSAPPVSVTLLDKVSMAGITALAISGPSKGGAQLVDKDSSAQASSGSSGEENLAGQDSVLVGINADGSSRSISISNSARGDRVARIYNMTKHVFFVARRDFHIFNSSGLFCPTVILTKLTGKLSCIPNVMPQELSDYLAANFHFSPFQEDSSGDILTFLGQNVDPPAPPQTVGNGSGATTMAYPSRSGYPSLYRLEMAGAVPRIVKIHDGNGYIEEFKMDSIGRVLFKYYDNDNRQGRRLRIANPDGSFLMAGPGEFDYCLTSYADVDNPIFYTMGPTAGADSAINSFAIEGGTVTRQIAFEIRGATGVENALGDYRCRMPVTGLGESIYNVSTFEPRSESPSQQRGANGTLAFLKYTPKGNAGQILQTGIPMGDVRRVFLAEKYMFVLGEHQLGSSMIVRLNSETGVATTVIPSNRFVISSMMLDQAGRRIVFTAKRMSDSALVKVSLNIDGSGVDEATILVLRRMDFVELIPISL